MNDNTYDNIVRINYNILASEKYKYAWFMIANYNGGYSVHEISNEDWALIYHVCRMVYYIHNNNWRVDNE